MSAQVIRLPVRQSHHNQALADLYRAEAALAKAGIPAVVDRGASDEGDPWVVFVRPGTGEVIAHVAIIDGEVIADSPAFTRPMRMRDAGLLIGRLIDGLRAAGLDRPQFSSGHGVLVALAVAIAALHMAESDGAAWSPVSPDLLAEAAGNVALLPMLMVVSASSSIAQHLPDSWVSVLPEPEHRAVQEPFDDQGAHVHGHLAEPAPPVPQAPHVETPPEVAPSVAQMPDGKLLLPPEFHAPIGQPALPAAVNQQAAPPETRPSNDPVAEQAVSAKQPVTDWGEIEAALRDAVQRGPVEIFTDKNDNVLVFVEADVTYREFIFEDGSHLAILGQAPAASHDWP